VRKYGRGCISIVTWWKEDSFLSIRKSKSTDNTHCFHGENSTATRENEDGNMERLTELNHEPAKRTREITDNR
jgi:hypothetical protein